MLTAIDNNDGDNTFVSTATATNITATTNKKDIYNQTCSNVGLCKTTSAGSDQAISHTIITV